MSRALEPWNGASDLDYTGLRWEPEYPHYTPVEILPVVGVERFQAYFKFAFVRNPWERMVSRYFYLRRQRAEPGKALNKRGYFPPGDRTFLEWIKGHEQGCVHPLDLRPQHDWLTNDADAICVDFVGRYERMASDFETVCRRLDLTAALPHENRSEHADYRQYYDAEAREFVKKVFERDIVAWRYEY